MKLPSINKKVLSIDFGASEIKIIEGQASKNGIDILNAITVSLPKDAYQNGRILDSDIISTLLKSSLKENKITTNLAYSIINSSEIITREVTIPKVPEKEVEAIIGYQLNEFLPVDPEDYVVQHLILDTFTYGELEKFNILLIGIPRIIVISHLDLMKNVGLKPQILDFQGNTIAKLIGFNSRINNDYNARDIVIVSIDMGYDSSKLTIIKNGNIEVTRVLDTGAKDLYESLTSFFGYSIGEGEEKVRQIEDINAGREEFTDYYRLLNITKSTIENLLEKIETILRYYRTRDMGNDINIVLLQGGLSNINGMDNLFSNYFNIPSIRLTSLDKIKLNGDLIKYSNAVGGLIRMDEV